ncbi:alpha/beta fold hydrolase [Salinivibrio sp. ES.052]|uniref:alpha/beta fold hydrolase n=1 Tax=Salinivibrio sp. ES.052 TaxID=1882823 RepID=UPI000928B052|nr:alpha/beta hydrolase [Salinivibrio sp. ES.052]SIN93734.1 Pimeloyl-ACP methyl ester carboxylesterase [Salinivibrio sp. ES.052]
MTPAQLTSSLDALLDREPHLLGLSSGLVPVHIPLNGVNVAAAVRPARGSAPTLVLMHGWQDNLASFHSLIPLLPQDDGLVLFDWPGHGLSDHKPGDYYYPFFDYLDDLHQVLNHPVFHQQKGCGPVVLVGHSLGGLVASCYAASFPNATDALVTIEALGPIAEPELKITERITSSLNQRFMSRQKAPRTFDSAVKALKLRASINKVAGEQLLPLIARGVMNCPQGVRWRHDPKLKEDALYRMAPGHSESIIRAINCPVLAIRATDGYPALRSADAARRATWFQQLTLEELPGTHHCHLQQPQQTVSLITDFVTKIQTRT